MEDSSVGQSEKTVILRPLSAATSQRKHQMQCRATLELVVTSCLVVDPDTQRMGLVSGVVQGGQKTVGDGSRGSVRSHLLSSVDQALLHGRDALLLLDLFLDLGHLEWSQQAVPSLSKNTIILFLLFQPAPEHLLDGPRWIGTMPMSLSYLVVALDVELDLLSREGADPMRRITWSALIGV